MPKKVVLIDGHPDTYSGRLCHALADAYGEGAVAAGAEVARVDVGRLDFPLLRTKKDFELGSGGTPETLGPAREAIVSSNHIVIFYPLWHGSMPALLKGFLEQLLRPGVALDEAKGRFPKPLFKGKSARVVVTMGMPVFAYRWYFGAHSLKCLKRNVLGFAGVNPIRDSLFGMVDSVTNEKRMQWLAQMRREGQRDLR